MRWSVYSFKTGRSSATFPEFQEEVLSQILDFLCLIHADFSLSPKQGEVSQVREAISSTFPSMLTPEYAYTAMFSRHFFKGNQL